MYLKIPSYPSPYSTTPLTNAYLFIGVSNFDHLQGTGQIEVVLWADEASAKTGLPPIIRKSYPIPAVTVETGGVGQPNFSLPPLSKIEADNAAVFGQLVQVFYGLILQDPEWVGATIVQED